LKEAEAECNRWAETSNERDDRERALKARLKEAEKVIAPFAAVADHDIGSTETDADYFRPMTVNNHAPRLRVGHLRAARAFLNAGEK
jgi:hypothetical protein